MSLSRERILSLTSATGFRPQTLEKVVRLGELLADIGRHPLLSKALVLKGGTALNLFFGPPRRLSVDLDFNYIAHLDRAEMVQERPEVERAVSLIGQAQGYQVQRSPDEHAGRKLFLNYGATSGSRDRIEVDLNFLFRLPLTPVRTLTMWQPGDLPHPKARVVGIEELAAGKLCALMDRAMPRDLFDAARLPELVSDAWGGPRLRKLFIAFAAILDHPLHRYGRDRFDRVTDEVVEQELWPMLSQTDQPVAEQLKQQAWAVVAPLLSLDSAEREFTDRVQHGELRPELLFPGDGTMVDRLTRHPALLWKAQNAREHAARSGRTRRKGER